MHRRIAGVAIAALCLLAPSAAAAQPPAMFRGDAAHTATMPETGAAAIDAVKFAFATGGPIRGGPVSDGRTVYFGSEDHAVYALDAASGRERWRVATGGAVTSTPAVADGRVYVASRDGNLYCLDAANGRVLWRLHFDADLGPQNYWDYFLSSPNLSAGVVYIGSGDGHLYAVDAASGRVRWRHDAGSRIRSSPALDDGRVYAGTVDGHVFAVDAADGHALWRFATEGASHRFSDQDNDTTAVMDSPLVASGMVVFGARDGFLYALDAKTGALRWRTTHDGSSWILSTATDGKTLYVGSGSALIVQAADLRTGAERWRFATNGAVFASLALAGDTVLASDFTGRLQGLRASDGALRWSFPMGGRSLSAPYARDGIVYCGSDDGVLYAFSTTAARVDATPPRRVVYWQGNADPKAFGWFKYGIDAAIRDQLLAAGYEQVDAEGLRAFLRGQIATPTRSIVVFADNKFPPGIADASGGAALLRRYLDAGGKVALLGPNPLAYLPDPKTGEVEKIDFDVPKRVFDAPYEQTENVAGYYASTPTDAGRAQGLREGYVGYMAIEPGSAGVTALATDEFGKPTAWLKDYGGPRGTGLLQLALPRERLVELSPTIAVLDYGITW